MCARIASLNHRKDAERLRRHLIEMGFYSSERAKDRSQEIGERIMLHKIVDHLNTGDLHALFGVAGTLRNSTMPPDLYDRYCMTDADLKRQARRFFKDIPNVFQDYILSDLNMDALDIPDATDTTDQDEEV